MNSWVALILSCLWFAAGFLWGHRHGTRGRRQESFLPRKPADLVLLHLRLHGGYVDHRVRCKLCDAKWWSCNAPTDADMKIVYARCPRCGAEASVDAMQRDMRAMLRRSLEEPKGRIKIEAP